jgi:hypothetical protein
MIDGRFGVSGRKDPVGTASCGMTVIARGGHIHAGLGGKAMDTASINFDGMIDEYLVLLGKIDILVTAGTGFRDIRGVCSRASIRRGQNIMGSVTVGTGRNIPAFLGTHPAVKAVLFTRILMAGPAAFA